MDTKECIAELIFNHYLDSVSDGERGWTRQDAIDYVLTTYNNGQYVEVYGALGDCVSHILYNGLVDGDVVEISPGLFRSTIDHCIMTS